MKKEEIYLKLIYRFLILKDKIHFGVKFNALDEKLIDILDEFDFLVDEIDEEQRIRFYEND